MESVIPCGAPVLGGAGGRPSWPCAFKPAPQSCCWCWCCRSSWPRPITTEKPSPAPTTTSSSANASHWRGVVSGSAESRPCCESELSPHENTPARSTVLGGATSTSMVLELDIVRACRRHRIDSSSPRATGIRANPTRIVAVLNRVNLSISSDISLRIKRINGSVDQRKSSDIVCAGATNDGMGFAVDPDDVVDEDEGGSVRRRATAKWRQRARRKNTEAAQERKSTNSTHTSTERLPTSLTLFLAQYRAPHISLSISHQSCIFFSPSLSSASLSSPGVATAA